MYLRVEISPINKEEKEYIIDILLKYIGCNYEIIYSSDLSCDYILSFNDKTVIIKDLFFNKYQEPLSYLKYENIPTKVIWFHSVFSTRYDRIPVIYGDNECLVEQDSILCGVEIFASSFFMLTSWEELVMNIFDKYGRCEENEMFVVKNKIFHRPIVEEYTELLKLMLEKMGFEFQSISRKFSIFLTHDIDLLFRYDSFTSFFKILLGDIFYRKSFSTLGKSICNYVRFRLGKGLDLYDTFDRFMNLSDLYSMKNYFFFMPSLQMEFDARYDINDKRLGRIVDNIIMRGHEIGVHFSMNSFHNRKQFELEYNRIVNKFGLIKGGRQHYLLYDVNETMRMWNEIKTLEYDSGLGFSTHIGFRCGCCFAYKFYDVYKRKSMRIMERPLIVMDVAAEEYCCGNVNDMYFNICKIIESVSYFQGELVLLWHNNNLDRWFLGKNSLYENLLKYIVNEK